MNSRTSRFNVGKALGVLLALLIYAGTMKANVLSATPSTVSLSCSTVTGPGLATTVTIKPSPVLAGSNTIAVTVGTLTGGVVVTPPSVTTLSTANQATGIVYTLRLANGCAGATTGAPTFQFNAGGVADVTITVNTTVTATASPLVASNVAITCAKNGNVYTPGAAKTISVTSATPGGTPFTVDTVTNAPPAWLTVNPTTGGSASATPITFNVVAAAGCGGFATGTTNVATLHLLNTPAPDKLVTVTLQVLAPSPIVSTPNPALLTYVKGSGNAGKVDVNLTSATNPAPFFSVDTASLPIWLTVDSTTGTVPKSIRFSSTNVADSLAPGSYGATVAIRVSGYSDLSLPVTLLVTNQAPKLTTAEGTTRNISWTLGQPIPTPFITLVSSDSPIQYSITTNGTLAPSISSSQLKGLAYNFGSQITVSFNPLVFAAAVPNSVLTGTVSITWGSPAATIVVTFNVTVLSPGATVTGITPASLPTANSGQTFTVSLTGTGFIPSTDITQKTKVGIVVSGAIVTDTNIATSVINPSNIILTFTVPVVADPNLPFSPTGTGGIVTLGVCNPSGGTCTIPTGTTSLAIGSNPIIQAVSSASSYIQVTAPTLQTLAPYDIVSIFGTNFCSSNATGCSSSQVITGTLDPTTLTYQTTVSPDAVSATQRLVSVTFQTHAGTPVAIANAPLLFVTNNQINILVPSAVSAQIGNTVDIVVNFGYATGTTMRKSAPFPVSVVATNPGIFTVGADGRGDGAALNSNWALITNTNPAGMRSTASDSDTIQLYVTGLGAPDSTGDNAATGSGAWSADCVSTSTYLSSLNVQAGSSLTSLDGALLQSSLLNTGRIVPCVATTSANVPTVSIGGVSATVTYAGWVADSIAGLYQMNITLPGSTGGPFTSPTGASISSITAPVQLPVVITSNGVASQTGVTLWVAPRLKVTGPTGAGLTGTVGVPWSSSNNVVIATEGTSPYRYAVTSGLLPAGLSLNTSTGAITGTPAANTAGSYIVTVTGTDAANVPVTGTVTFTITVAGGLVVKSSGTAPYNGTFGTANSSLTAVTATGGTFPYTYAITSPSSLPTGMTINASTGVVGITALTPAGTYHVTVLATDSTSGTALTGSLTFDIVVALHLTKTGPVNGANGVASNISTVTATGGTGTITYTLDATTLALANGWVTIDANTGVGAITTDAPASTTQSVTVTATDDTAPTGAATAGTGSITFTITVI